MNKIIAVLCTLALFVGCKKQEKKDRELIDNYVAANSLKGQFTSSGLYYTIEREGSGGFPLSTSSVTVEYTGYLLDGKKFDGTTSGNPISFDLNQVITGWQEGIPKFQKGGKGKLIIPSAMAYGRRAQSSIPANSVLVFDIHLVDWD